MTNHIVKKIDHQIIVFMGMLMVESRGQVSGLPENSNTLVLGKVLDPSDPLIVEPGQAQVSPLNEAERLGMLYTQIISDHTAQFDHSVGVLNRIGFDAYQAQSAAERVYIETKS
jgi:hypothetical protein